MSEGARKQTIAVPQGLTVPAPVGDAHANNEPELIEPAVESSGKSGEISTRPTTVPDYNVEALAAALHSAKGAALPLDLAVPMRRQGSVDHVPVRAAFLLSHVDGRMSVAELASCAQIPIADAIEAFG